MRKRIQQSDVRRESCKQAECSAYLYGFETIVPQDSMQEDYIINRSGRMYTHKIIEGGLHLFAFAKGQACWESPHIEKLFVTQDTSSGLRPVTQEPLQWIDEFNEESYKAHRRIQGG